MSYTSPFSSLATGCNVQPLLWIDPNLYVGLWWPSWLKIAERPLFGPSEKSDLHLIICSPHMIEWRACIIRSHLFFSACSPSPLFFLLSCLTIIQVESLWVESFKIFVSIVLFNYKCLMSCVLFRLRIVFNLYYCFRTFWCTHLIRPYAFNLCFSKYV